jgi:integrase
VASVNRELATLRRLLRLAHEWRVIGRVPRIRLLRGERNREFVLGHDAEQTYLATLNQPLRDVAVLLLDTGLRVGEALSLEWPDVRLEPANGASHGFITVRAVNSKNSKRRSVPLTDRAAGVLSSQDPKPSGLVFSRSDGSRLSETWLDQQQRAVREALKLSDEFVLHSLRHTYGTRLGEAGADGFTIMKLMGHSTITVSQKYVHPTSESVERAIARLEALNAAKQNRGDTIVGTEQVEEQIGSRQLFRINMPGWRNRQTQRT